MGHTSLCAVWLPEYPRVEVEAGGKNQDVEEHDENPGDEQRSGEVGGLGDCHDVIDDPRLSPDFVCRPAQQVHQDRDEGSWDLQVEEELGLVGPPLQQQRHK